MKTKSQCLDGSVPVLYRWDPDGEIYLDSIRDLFDAVVENKKNFYIPTYSICDNNKTVAYVNWARANVFKTTGKEVTTVYLEPDFLEVQYEFDNIIRCAPDATFPVYRDVFNSILDIDAMNLHSGDLLLSSTHGIEDTSYFNESEITERNLRQDAVNVIKPRKVIKTVTNYVVDVDKDARDQWNFYGISIIDKGVSPYYVLPNNIIVTGLYEGE